MVDGHDAAVGITAIFGSDRDGRGTFLDALDQTGLIYGRNRSVAAAPSHAQIGVRVRGGIGEMEL